MGEQPGRDSGLARAEAFDQLGQLRVPVSGDILHHRCAVLRPGTRDAHGSGTLTALDGQLSLEAGLVDFQRPTVVQRMHGRRRTRRRCIHNGLITHARAAPAAMFPLLGR